MSRIRTRQGASRVSRPTTLTENDAASAIQAWFQGNNERHKQERITLEENVEKGVNGPSGFQAQSSLRRRGTVKFSKVLTKIQDNEIDVKGGEQHFFAEAKFAATLKGIVDVQGRLTEPFTLMIVLSARDERNDKDLTKYDTYLALHVDFTKAWFSMKRNGQRVEDLTDNTEVTLGSDRNLGLDPDTITTYWLSYDRDNMCLKYGKGYAMEETTLLTCDFSEGADTVPKLAKKRKQYKEFFAIFNPDRTNDVTILLYRSPGDIAKSKEKSVKLDQGEGVGYINVESLIEVRKEPLTANPSPFVMSSDQATLNIIDKGQYIFSSELPPSCKILYDTVRKCELDLEYEMGAMDVRLSDAIRYSIETEGALLNNLLKTKSYLRITMGKARGESPGVPYVLEIWPKGSRSIIHNHGAVCAVIKVLFGTIQVGIFNKVTSTVTDKKNNFRPTELFKFNAFKNDVTWISPEWFQTHQLRNVSQDYCATVQCYRYDENDNIQWNQFDYVNDDGIVGNFFPNSDFTFGVMRKKVLQEWENRLNR